MSDAPYLGRGGLVPVFCCQIGRGAIGSWFYVDTAMLNHQMDQRNTREYIIAKLSGGHPQDNRSLLQPLKVIATPMDISGLF